MAPEQDSSTFSSFHEQIQKWIWEQNWSELREAQERAAAPIMSRNTDVIISSSTASGKTEAAFFPILSTLLKEPTPSSVLYISPLKALINDQISRMELLCEKINIPIYPWHGDIGSSNKKKFLKNGQGILLITPESLEAIFVNHGHSLEATFKHLKYVVIDEIHSFIESVRGRQLQSLLGRIEHVLAQRIPRIGLSATLGDMSLAQVFLRSKNANQVLTIQSKPTGSGLKLLLRGYVNKKNDAEKEEEITPQRQSNFIWDNLYSTHRGTSNLIFTNKRSDVEFFSNKLRTMCEENHVPNEFFAHHGSLSKETRLDVERAIKEKAGPINIVCTQTLEMGIDIGSVKSVSQLGAPFSVASLRQRLGRSGRRGEPAILWLHVAERELAATSSIQDILRTELVQTVAIVNLLLKGWCEPPRKTSLHLSTLIQQILSIIAQYGGISAQKAFQILCQEGPFYSVNRQMFMDVLRSMAKHDLIKQASDGIFLHGIRGEKIVNHYTFYAAFMSTEEYRLYHQSRFLGNLPITTPLMKDSLLIFSGQRWHVVTIDPKEKIISLKPASGGIPPQFSGEGGYVHDQVRMEMFNVYKDKEMPVFLDQQGRELLEEARDNFYRLQLDKKYLLKTANAHFLFLWMGDAILNTVSCQLKWRGIKADRVGMAVELSTRDHSILENELEGFCVDDFAPVLELARTIENKVSHPYDEFLSEELLCADYASAKLDREGAQVALRKLFAP